VIAHDFISAPAVVVGGGIAGLSTALSLDACAVVTGGELGDGASRLAQGGIAAAIAADDSPAMHAADTLRVAAGLADPDTAALVTGAAPARIAWLLELGVAFDLGLDGKLALGREAGHRRDRIVHAGGDRTGCAVMQALRAAVLARPEIRVLEQYELVDLITCGARVAGVLLAAPDGRQLAVVAPQVVLATGGVGACFARSTNPATSRGAGLAAAARRGVRLADLEFVQFHPTALATGGDPLPLLTEALRGAGAVLLDAAGERFMAAIHPDAELAPRDVVARSVAMREADGQQVYLDARPVSDLETRFPGAVAAARAAGANPLRQPLPVTTAAHFHMGGIATDSRGATSLPGLWACGEVAATGLHGGNRLASNSLLEGLVFGARTAAEIRSSNFPMPRKALEVPRRPAMQAADPARIRSLRRMVGDALGPSREGGALRAALLDLESWQSGSRVEDDMVAVARLMLRAALDRRESRGAHHRRDYPSAAAIAARSFVVPRPSRIGTLGAARSRVA
jgi:L-aspartate oxidase